MPLKNFRITVNDLEVSCLEKEAIHAGVTLVFIHGFPFGKEIWRPQLEALPEDIPGLAYDIRGYGESSAGHGFFSVDLFAADLIALIQNLKLEKVILCGVSMGGYIALRAFERSPKLFSGMILCDTTSLADINESKLNRFASIEKIMQQEKAAFAGEFVKKILSRKTQEERQDIVSPVYKMITSLPDSTICATQLALASRTDTTHVLETISVPALIIRGEEDQIISQAQAEFLQSRIKDSALAEIPQSGHLPNLENSEAFNKVMNEFLRPFLA